MPAAELARRGHKTKVLPIYELVNVPAADFDIVVFQRPVYPLANLIAVAKENGAKIIVDLDDDFLGIPETHPGRQQYAGPEAIHNLMLALGSCDALVVSTEEMRKRYGGKTVKRTVVIPNGWDATNMLWKARLPHDTINIGWCGSLTHREDQELIRNPLLRLARERADVRIVIGADEAFYKSFKLPESQKVFIPGVTYPDYPAMLAWFDILLAPLKDTEFNRAKSDIKLVEAGARGIPWVASPLPMYCGWMVGGMFARLEAEWYGVLKRLLDNPELRADLGKEGRDRAAFREQGRMDYWESLVNSL